ncbi:MAG: hypothetical protein WBA46_09685 [Thermomicrobiales bacterium]
MPHFRSCTNPRFAGLTRRQAIQAAGGVAAVAAGTLNGGQGVLAAQATPEASPAAGGKRDTESWFVVSPQDPAGGFTTQADVFEVYSGVTLEKMGGFRAPGTIEMCVTADPGKILISQGATLSIFDLEAGRVFPVEFIGEPPEGGFWLPDPRIFPVSPAPCAIVRNLDATLAWLIDLERHTATELVEQFATVRADNPFPAVSFAPDGSMAAAKVIAASAVVFDPANPEQYRKVDGGVKDAIASLPRFSDSGARMTYCAIADGDASTGWVVVQEVDRQEVIARIDGVDPASFSIFLPGSESLVLIVGGGEAVIIDAESGRELVSTETSPAGWAYGFSTDGTKALVGTRQLTGEEIRWQTLDIPTGEAKDLDELEALTFYSGSYEGTGAIHTLFGPPYMAQGDEVVDALVGFNSDTMETTPLLDDVSSWALSYGYSTSADCRIALFVMYDASLMNLETGDVQVFPQITTGSSARGSFVSPDGTKAAISAWDSTGSGTQQVLLIDVEVGGKPEPFVDGVLWLWAGGVPASSSGAQRGIAMTTSGWTGLRLIAPQI